MFKKVRDNSNARVLDIERVFWNTLLLLIIIAGYFLVDWILLSVEINFPSIVKGNELKISIFKWGLFVSTIVFVFVAIIRDLSIFIIQAIHDVREKLLSVSSANHMIKASVSKRVFSNQKLSPDELNNSLLFKSQEEIKEQKITKDDNETK